ncbi:MAG: beta-lactamase family protein [Alphaproteobacteria bacterium]|nr:beta-lactamase family protein [Alphaproteobacteria bacterium]MBU2378633.1 beta-lactamase family protein [Alphaproteobacteria bacterium]
MTITRRKMIQVAAAAAWVASPAPAPARAQVENVGADAALEAALAEAGAPALAGMIVGPDGPVWMGAGGLRRRGAEAAATVDDLWHLGSNTKAMTAALYGRLVDQERASWTATAADLFPDVAMDAAWRDAPVTAFMGHVAGLKDETALGRDWLMTARDDPRTLSGQRRALVTAMLTQPPAGSPGAFAYANSNYVVIGAAIERIVGHPWEDVMRAEVFAPLGIETGGFGAPAGDQPWGHRGGVAIDPAGPVTDNPQAMAPAGTVHMSLGDYARFLRVFLTNGDGWLSPESLAVLMRPAGAGQPAYAGGWLVAGDQPWAGGPALTHNGSNTMWYASTWVAPGVGRAFVSVSNDGEQGAAACQRLIPGLIRANLSGPA